MILSVLESLTSGRTTALVTAALVLLKMTCVLVTALAVTLAMRRASAGARHLVWLVALAALLVLPALAVWAPVPIRVLPMAATQTTPSIQAPVTGPPAAPAAPASGSTPRVDAAASPVSPSSASAAAPRRAFGAVPFLIALWSLGVLVLLARLGLGAWSVRRIVRGARPLERAEWQRPLFEIADRLGLRDAPELLQSDRVKIPFASGFLKGRIVLPAESEGWSPDRRSAVLMHELGHVRRRDLIGHTVSRIVCALYWFHPLVWTSARRLRVESERACDDLALGLGARPSEYAEHLLDIVTEVRAHGTPVVALAMANPNEFEGRMLAILNPQVRRRAPGRMQAAWLVASVAVLALVVGAVSPARRAAAKPHDDAPSSQDATAQVAHEDRAVDARDAEASVDRAGAAEATEDATDSSTRTADEEATSDGSGNEAASEEADGSHRVAILAKTLRSDSSPEVRRVAAWGLERYARSTAAAEALAAALAGDEDGDVREMAAWGLSEAQGNAAAVAALQAAFRRDKSAAVRRTATWAAGSNGDRAAVPGLVGLLADASPEIREVAAWSIGSCNADRAPAALVRLLADSNRDVRLSVAWALREIADPDASDELEAAFHREKDHEVQQGLIRALGAMGDRAIDTLTRLVSSPDPEIRAVAIAALAGGDASGPWPWPRPEPRPYP